MKKKIDCFVLIILLISTVVDSGIIFSRTFINNETILYMTEFLMGLGYLIVFIRFFIDSNYKTLYYLGFILLTVGVEEGLYYIKDMYFPLYNIYINTAAEGVTGAFIFAYFYETFKRMSYNHVEDFNKKHNITYNEEDFKL